MVEFYHLNCVRIVSSVNHIVCGHCLLIKENETHPVNSLAEMRVEDNRQRLASMDKIRAFVADHSEMKVFGYHNIEEFNEFMD